MEKIIAVTVDKKLKKKKNNKALKQENNKNIFILVLLRSLYNVRI